MHLPTLFLLGLAHMGPSSVLQQRALPKDFGCTACEPNDDPWYQKTQDDFRNVPQSMLDDAAQASSKTWPAGYTPEICSQPAVNCMTSAPGVKWTDTSGLTPPLGTWNKEDGTTTIAWEYWQSTLQWVGNGGSGTTYNAHCTILTCVKGRMQAVVGNETITGDGIASEASQNKCGCFPKDWYADITFSLF